MNTPKLQHVSVQIRHAILNSGRIPGLREDTVLSTRSGRQWGHFREYTVPTTGSGAGKGGGAGGSVRESGGALGQYGAAHEEEFFYHKQREQLEKIKSKLKKEEPKSPSVSQKPDK